MKGSISILFLLMLFTSCSNTTDEQNRVQLSALFPEIHLSEDEGLYMDRDDNMMRGHLTTHYKNGNLHASLTFSGGLITDGVIRLQDGTLHSDYSMADGLNYHTRYWPDGKPQILVSYKDNYNNQREFHVWNEDGTPVIASNSHFMRTWHENGQLRMEMVLKGEGKHGITRTWHINGELKTEARFESEPHTGVYRE